MQIVEMNISLRLDNINILDSLEDIQKRIIECESWKQYVNYFLEYNGDPVGYYTSVKCNLIGFVLPKHVKIYDLTYDDHKLTCTVCNWKNQLYKKIACIVQ